jgi:MOSC domain-containing protein YiiM
MESVINILNIWISPGHDFVGRHGKDPLRHEVREVNEAHLVAGKGIEGDRYFAHREDYKGQITFFSESVARQLEATLECKPLDRSVMRRNVLIDGVDLNALVGKRFQIGDVLLTGSEECAPCYWMDRAVKPGAHSFLKGNGGLRCRIEHGGLLRVGESVLQILE